MIIPRSRVVGTYFRGWVPARTQWCARIEYDHITVPADVDEAIERLYERIVEEHVSSELSVMITCDNI